MKKLVLSLPFMIAATITHADEITERSPTGSPVSRLLLVVGVIAIAALLYVRYRRSRPRS